MSVYLYQPKGKEPLFIAPIDMKPNDDVYINLSETNPRKRVVKIIRNGIIVYQSDESLLRESEQYLHDRGLIE